MIMRFKISKTVPAWLCLTLLLVTTANAAQQETGSEIAAIKDATDINVEACRLNNYHIKFNVMDGKKKAGKAERRLWRQGNNMQLHSKVKASVAFMTFEQSEQSELSAYVSNGLQSVNYSKTKKKPFKKAKTNTYAIDRVFDPLSVYDHLRELVCSGLSSNIVLNVQDEKRINAYQFSYHGKHKLSLPLGEVDAVLVKRTRPTSTRETSIWFDTNNHYLPVQIQQEKEGETQATLVAKSVSVNAQG